jgi:hypothetical protein
MSIGRVSDHARFSKKLGQTPMSSGFKQMLLLKIPAKQGIIAEREAKPKSRRRTARTPSFTR